MAGDGIRIPITPEIDTGAVDQEVMRLTDRMNKLGQTVAQMNRLKFNPVDRAAVDDLRRVEAQFQSLVKINGQFRRALQATGQSGLPFTQVDLSRVRTNAVSQQRVYDYVTAGTTFSGRMQAPPAPPGGGGGGGGGGGAPPAPDPYFPGQGVVNAGLRASGPVGGVAANALGVGMKGGMLAGAGAMLGGLAVLGVTKAIGAVREKVGDAEQEGIGYDTLKRQLGDVGVSFDMLRGSVRQAAYDISVGFNEAQRLAGVFAKMTNAAGGEGGMGLYREIQVGGGLARALGLDPGAGVGAMGTLRQFGVTGDEAGSRRFALMIGEAVGRVGFAKADEVLAAVTQFTATQTRASLASANVPAYLGALAGLAGSGRPGLDAQGSAALLSRVNATIMSGGGFGEAGSNFMLANVGRGLGLSPIQTKMLLEHGAFGTGSKAFGQGSLYAQFSGRSIGAGGSNRTTLESVLGGLKRSYGPMGSDMLAAATSNLLGVNLNQAMALHTYGAATMGGIEGRLKGKVPMSALNPSAFAALAAIQTGDAGTLRAQAESLRSRTGGDALTPDERKRLDAAMAGGSVDEQRQVLTELTATREQEMTEGKATRDSIEAAGNKTQEFATKLVPLATTMRDALVAMAAVLAPDSAFGKAAKQVEAIKARDKQWANLSGDLTAFDAETESIKQGDRYKSMPEGMQRKWMEERARIREMKQGELWRQFGGTGDADSLMNQLIAAESGGRHYGPDGQMLRSSKGALGLTQVMPATGKDPGFGVKPLQNNSPEEYYRFGRDYLGAMLRRYGGDKARALGAYNHGAGNVDNLIGMYGDDWLSHAPAETQAYVQKILSYKGAGAGRGGQGGATADEIHANLVLHPKTPDGKSAGKPVKVQIGKPQPAGATP